MFQSFEYPIQIHSVCPGDMSHVRAAAFDAHLNHGIVVFHNDHLGYPPGFVYRRRHFVDL